MAGTALPAARCSPRCSKQQTIARCSPVPRRQQTPRPGSIFLLPRVADGRSVNPNWDTLGMRATRSDSLVLEECWVPESAVVFQSDDIGPFRHAHLNWFWGSYTAVYLGVAAAAYDEVHKMLHARQPQGYDQPL